MTSTPTASTISRMSRARDGPAEFLKDYRGFLQADAYGGYDGIYLDSQGRIIEVACWAHARGKFFDARSNAPREANQILEWIRQLYDIEDRARDFTPAARLELRQRESVPILDRIENYLAELKERMLAQVGLGQGGELRPQPVGGLAAVHDGRPADDRQQCLGADAATPGHRAKELDVPGECRGGPAGGGVVHDPGGSQASSPGAVGVPSRRGAEAERGRDGSGVVASGPLGREPPGACAAAPPGRVAAEGDPPEGSAAGAPCDRRAEGVRAADAEVGKGS